MPTDPTAKQALAMWLTFAMPSPLCLSNDFLRPALPLSSDKLDVQREYLAQACAAADKAEDEVKELQEQVSL